MSAVKKPIVALLGVMAMLLVGLFVATSPADAYPNGTPPTLSVSDTSPTCGETVTVSGSHFQPGETVTITQGGQSVTVTANSSGSFTTSIKIVCNGTSPGAITATGNSSGDVASISLTNGGNNGNGNGNNGGNLSTTGVAVIGIGALGVVLLIGGGLLLLAGRRRSSASA